MTSISAIPADSGSTPTRGRPRDLDTDENILAAARELLAAGGFEAMSFEAIAQRAGVTRPTVYRRWPSKAHLAHQIAHGGGRRIPDVIETQGLEAQIRAFVELLLEQYRRPEMVAAYAGLSVTYQSAPELREQLHTPLELQTRRDLAAIVAKGKALNLIDPEIDAELLFDVAVGAVVFRAMHSSLPISEIDAGSVCTIILKGIAAR